MTQKEYEIVCRFIDLHLSKNDKTEELKEDINLLVEKKEAISISPTITAQPNYMLLGDKTKYSGDPIFDSPYINKFTSSISQNKDIKTTC